MSTQAVSILQEIQGFYQDRRADLKQLGAALKAGNVDQAQQVYDALVALGQGGPFKSAEPFAKTARSQAFDAIGQALQAGDLVGAQTAFDSLSHAQGTQNNVVENQAFVVNLTIIQGSTGTSEAVPTDSIYQQRQEFREQRKAGLEQLGQALKSGDVDAAQQAYDALVTLGQNGPLRNGQTFHRADRAQDFAAIGDALASGNLDAASAAFAALDQTFGHNGSPIGSLPPGPPTPIPPHETSPPTPGPTPIPPGPTGPPTPAPTPTTAPPEVTINVGGTPSTNGSAGEIVINLPQQTGSEEIQINFGDQNGSTGHLTIDVNHQDNGSESVSIDFNRGSSNYQLVLNLFAQASDTAAQRSQLSLQA
jgi:hypothetical protein